MVINDSIECYRRFYIYIFHLIKDILGGMLSFGDDREVYTDRSVYILKILCTFSKHKEQDNLVHMSMFNMFD